MKEEEDEEDYEEEDEDEEAYEDEEEEEEEDMEEYEGEGEYEEGIGEGYHVCVNLFLLLYHTWNENFSSQTILMLINELNFMISLTQLESFNFFYKW